MTAKLRELELRAPDFSADVDSSVGRVRVHLSNPNEERPGSLAVEVGAKSSQLRGFAERGPRAADGKFPAVISALIFEEPILVLVGLYAAYTIGVDSVLRKLFDLFRSQEDDAGFYQRPELILRAAHAILKYESGIACFDMGGRLKWHLRCHYDDELVRIDDCNLWFSNEHVNDGREWSVGLADGKRR